MKYDDKELQDIYNEIYNIPQVSEIKENTKINSNLYCTCEKPKIILNNAGGETFNFCTICKKERI